MSVRVLPRTQAAEPVAPPRVRRWNERFARLRLPPLFVLIVVLPIALAAIYEFFIASPRYVSEARFIVRAPQQQTTVGLGGFLQSVGIGQSEDQAYAVHEYIMSREAIADLVKNHHFLEMLDRPGSDFVTKFPRPFEGRSMEALYAAYPRYVTVGHDSITGVSTLRVKLFRPQDAQEVANALLQGGEDLVNRLNDRAAADAVAQAQHELALSEDTVLQDQRNLTAFRNREGLVDPSRSSAAGLELVTKLTGEMQTLQAERAGLAATAPKDPQLPVLDSRIKGYQREIAAQNAAMAGETTSLAPKIGQYEDLTLQRDFADKLVANAAASLDEARQDARRKRLYLEPVVSPNLPDAATLPHRWASLGLVIVSAFIVYAMVALIIAAFQEHRQS
ncbi:MAG TPA: chain-length determining protein [Caulobacteraceae bacterium]|nr:chain-length determining protein [Caulobacteraceae bacterium]